MIKKSILSILTAFSLISSPVVAHANISENIIESQIEELSESKKRILKILLDYSVYNKCNDIDADNYFSALSLNLNDLSLEKLLKMRMDLQSSNSVDSTPVYAAEMTANYIAWLDEFGIDDTDLQPSYSDKNEKNIASLFIDDIAVGYYYDTLKIYNAALFFMDPDVSDDEIDIRVLHALAFFSALEYGKPIEYSDSEIDDIMNATWKLYEKLQICTVEKEEELLDGELTAFYSSGENSYYLSSSPDAGIIIVAY